MTNNDLLFLIEKGVRIGKYRGKEVVACKDGLMAYIAQLEDGRPLLLCSPESVEYFRGFSYHYQVAIVPEACYLPEAWDVTQIHYRNTCNEETTYSYVEDRVRGYKGSIPWSKVHCLEAIANETGDGIEYAFFNTLTFSDEFEDVLPVMAGIQISNGSKATLEAFCLWTWAMDWKL